MFFSGRMNILCVSKIPVIAYLATYTLQQGFQFCVGGGFLHMPNSSIHANSIPHLALIHSCGRIMHDVISAF